MKIGFIGLGNMGAPMARHLIAQGFDLSVFDTSAEAVAGFGAASASSLADVGRGRDIIITMLPNGDIVRQALIGDGGALADAGPGTIVVDTSSSDAGGTRRLGAELRERGIALLDAPVSGGVALAGEGKLSIMVGTDDQLAFDRVRAVIETLGSRIIPVGGLGAGHAAKAINNAIAAAIVGVTAEGLLLGQRFGLDPQTLLDVINASTGKSQVSDTIFRSQILPRKFSLGFSIGLMAKDVGLAVSLVDQLGLDLPMLATAGSTWAAARDDLSPQADFTAYLRHVENDNGGDPIS